MSVIENVKTYLLTYPELSDDAGFLVEQLGKTPTQYALVQIPSERIVETYLDASTLRQFTFALQSMESIADDLVRIANSGFYEALADWFDSQTEDGVLPSLGTGKTAEKIEALGWGTVQEYGDSGTGIYQIQCRVVYEQVAP